MGKFQAGLYEALSVHVRHRAWLNATLERPENFRSKTPPQTRLQRMRTARGDEDYEPTYPPIDGCEHLIGYLFEAGPLMKGPSPLTHTEINAWASLMGLELRPWEARFLKRLSMDYLAELQDAAQPMQPAPWSGNRHDQLKSAANSMRSSISALAEGWDEKEDS